MTITTPTVYTKKQWSDEWVHRPMLFPVSADDPVGPSIATARFLWRYGSVSIDGAEKETVSPGDFFGHYVRIARPPTADEYLADPTVEITTIWLGRITSDADTPGDAEGALPCTGHNVLTARGLVADLLRCRIYGSVAMINSTVTRVDSVFNFNVSARRGGPPAGNRSASKHENPASGRESYIFDDVEVSGDEKWRASDIIEYLLVWFAPIEPAWTLGGQTAALDVFTRVVAPAADVATTIDRLVDRRNSMAWSVYVGGGEPEVQIRSTLSEAITVKGSTVPANDAADEFDTDTESIDEALESVTIERSGEHRYNRIIARGERVVVCGSVTVGTGCDNSWSAAAKTAYEADTDAERASDKYRNVITTFTLKTPTGGTKLFYDAADDRTGTCPTVAENGQLNRSGAAPIFLSEKTLLRQLPLLTGYTYDGGSVILSDASDPHEFVPPLALVKSEIDGESAYGFVDRFTGFDDRPNAGMSLTMLDNAPGFRIKPAIPHILAKNNFTAGEPTVCNPVFDYTEIVATVAIASDVHLQIIKNTGSASGAADDDPSRTLVIDVPWAEAWWICAGTVVDCVDGKLVRTPNGIEARNDYIDLEAVADLAAEWYKRDRHATKIRFKTLYYSLSPGDMITRVSSGGRTIEINSTVTRVRWDFVAAKTAVDTDFGELDFANLAAPRSDAVLSASSRPLTRDNAANNSPVRTAAPGAEPAGFWARITGNDGDPEYEYRWKYSWAEVKKSTAGYGGWIADGRTGSTTVDPAYNSIEDINDGTPETVQGNGVDPDNLDGDGVTTFFSFALQPCTTGNPVWMREVVLADESVEYWFSYETGVDGACTEPD